MAIAFAYALGLQPAAAEWKYQFDGTLGATLSNNINLSPAGQEETDLVISVTPAIVATNDSARLKGQLYYAPQFNLYASNYEENYVNNTLNAFATLEAVDDFFYVDASASSFLDYVSPFGPQPQDGTSRTANQTQTTTLQLSPYIRGVTGSNISYLLRDDNYYTIGGASVIRNVYTNNLVGTLDGLQDRRWSWGADYNYNYTQFEDQDAQTLQLARLRLTYRVNPYFDLTGTAGYEKNDYFGGGYAGAIYGGGFAWRPTPRTDVYARYERRFFGPSYAAGFNHRRRKVAWTLEGSRNIQTYQEQLLLTPGTTRSVLDSILLAKVPDPAERKKAVDEFLALSGLPASLSEPLPLYTNQIYVLELISGTVAWVGTRNSASLTLYWSNQKPITISGTTLPPVFFATNSLNQRGGTASFSHKLSARTSLVFSVDRIVSLTDDTSPTTATIESTQTTYRLILSQRLSAKTFGGVGVRSDNFDSNSAFSSYTEQAVFAFVTHRF